MAVLRRTQASAHLWFCAATIAVGVFAVLISWWQAGGGHGSYLAAKLLLPFAMLATIPTGEISIASVMLALAQWPIYGAVLANAFARNRQKAILILAVVHTAASFGCLALVSRETFP